MFEISLKELSSLDSDEYMLIDIRSSTAAAYGSIPNSVHISEYELLEKSGNLPKNKKIILYCVKGDASIDYALRLKEKGFDAYSLKGGYNGWLIETIDNDFTDEQTERYSRHILLDEVGIDGQKKLLNSRVLIIGAGGLGSPAAMYLAAAGIGTIGIADADKVDLSNLQRQIMHSSYDVGKYKVLSAKETIKEINPDINVITYNTFVNAGNIMDIIRDYDFIIDGTDNFSAKFVINDACVMAGKPFSYAGIIKFKGQLMTYVPQKGTCLRCIFKEPPSSAIPTCAQAGVIGAVGGVIGSLQALEAIKYILGTGSLLTSCMLTFDALTAEMRKIKFPKHVSDCPICRDNPSIRELKDCEQIKCGL